MPYITNMAHARRRPRRQAAARDQAAVQRGGAGGGAPAARGAGGGGGGGGGGRGGTKSEPWMPFQPWSAAVYDYNSINQSKYDPEGYCLPPGGPRMMATPYPAGDHPAAGAEAHLHDLRRRHAHLARDLHGRPRSIPEGDALNPTYLGYSVGHWEGTRSSSTSSASTRTAGSTTSATRTPT